ncbi:MAG: hypothetical protein RLZZ399_2186, partial [Verrucomicrobiota bacterium]
MKTARLSPRLLSIIFFVLAGDVAHCAGTGVVAQLPGNPQAFLKEYCLECHNAEKAKGEVRLDNLSLRIDSVPTADLWQKVLNQMNSGEMPPEKSKQPTRELKANFLGALAETLMVARKSLGDSGGKLTLRRLNKREYQNTVRDLLGVTVDVTELPQDGSADTFDTVGNALGISSSQFESYLALGKKAVEEALIREKAKSQIQKYHRDSEEFVNKRQNVLLEQHRSAFSKYQQWMAQIDEMARLPEHAATVQDITQRMGQRGDFKAAYYTEWHRLLGKPATKDFGYNDASSITFFGRAGKNNAEAIEDYYKRPQTESGVYLGSHLVHNQEGHRIPDAWPPGEYVYRYRIAAADDAPWHRRFVQFGVHRGGLDNFDLVSTHEVTGTLAQPQILEVKVRVGSEPNRTFSIREKRRTKRGTDNDWVKEAVAETGHAPIPMIWVDWTEIEGPLPPKPGTPAPVSLLTSRSDAQGAREVLERFAQKAFRGVEPDKEYLDRLVSLFEQRVAHGDRFEAALTRVLSIVLASPPFLYLAEDGTAEKPHLITDIELANRLAYFLWSAPPDEALLTLAKQGQLRTPAVLQQQIDRMIASDRFQAFLSGFLPQWLGMDRLDFFDFPTDKHRHFDDSMKVAARQEVYETFAHTLRSRGSFATLLRSNQVVVNGL